MRQTLRIITICTITMIAISLTTIFPASHDLHHIAGHLYYFAIIFTAIWFRTYLPYFAVFLVGYHLIIDGIHLGKWPMEAMYESIVQLALAMVLFFVIEKRDHALHEQSSLVKSMQIGLAKHSIILDDDKNPVDYRFVYLNEAFEKITGLKAKDLVGKTVLEVLPNTEQQWIDQYGEVALKGTSLIYRNYSASLSKWFEVTAYSPAPLEFVTLVTDITDSIHQEEQLIIQQQLLDIENDRFTRLVESVTDIIFELDVDKRFTAVYGRGLETFGFTSEEVLGKTVGEVFGNEASGIRDQAYSQALMGKTQAYEWAYQSNGKTRYFESTVSPIKDRNNTIVGAAGIAREITETKQLQIEIVNNESRLTNIIKATNAGTWEWNIQTGETKYNERWAEIIGYTLEELEPLDINTWTKYAHPDDLRASDKMIEKAFNKELEYYVIETRMKHKEGHWVWLLDSGKVNSWTEDGKPLIMSGTHIDITLRKQVQEELEKSQKMLRTILNTIPVRVFWKDLNLNYLGCNYLFAKDSNLESLDSIIGKNDYELVWKDQADLYRSDDQHVMDSGKPKINYIEPQTTPNGGLVWLRTSKVPLVSPENEVFGVLGTYEDITQQKMVEEQLIQSENRYRSIISASNTGAWEYNQKNRQAWCSKEYFTMLGYESNDFPQGPNNIDQIWVELIHPEDRSETIERFEGFLAKETQEFYDTHFRIRRKDGSYAWIWARGEKLKDAEGNTTDLTIGVHIDISGLKEIEQELYIEKIKIEETIMSIGDAVIATNKDGIIERFNGVSEQLTGWSKEEAIGTSFEQVFNIVDEDSREPMDNPVHQVMKTKEKIELSNHTVLISKDGAEYFIEDSAAPILNANGEMMGVVLVFRDVTEKKAKQREIEYLSTHDYLTGLYNRRYFENMFYQMDKAKHYPLCIIMLDVNGLKLINDAFGHDIGDEVLKQVADAINKGLKSTKGKFIASRIGGDEFAVLLVKTHVERSEEIKNAILDEISKLCINNVHISSSAGVGLKDNDSNTVQDVLKQAENFMYKRKLIEGKSMRNHAIQSILQTLTAKYEMEKVHSERVGKISKEIGKAMRMKSEDLKELELAGFIHDIGKISIPDEILDKPSQLTKEEYEIIKSHTETGYQILRTADEYSDLAEYALSHHERWDGTGYPNGIKGKEIPLVARIIGVADAYEAMTSDRPYRKSIGKKVAVEELLKYAGTQFDPDIVSIFVDTVLKKNNKL